jgi:hypothetical protein
LSHKTKPEDAPPGVLPINFAPKDDENDDKRFCRSSVVSTRTSANESTTPESMTTYTLHGFFLGDFWCAKEENMSYMSRMCARGALDVHFCPVDSVLYAALAIERTTTVKRVIFSRVSVRRKNFIFGENVKGFQKGCTV